ncbi:MAG: xanthine dehydrogenase family protein molybdopterin-binding subunit [Myxococcota bacterium]
MAAVPTRVGEPIRRREDPRLIRGLAHYCDDLKLHGMLHAAFVRSDRAAGRIVRIDVDAALACEGISAVYTFDDMRGQVGPAPALLAEGMEPVERTLLADRRVCYVGQPLAVVIASDRYRAHDAALSVRVEIDPLPAIVDPERALSPEAPLVHPELGSNLAFTVDHPDSRVEGAFAAADATLELRLLNPRVAPVSMEGRAVLARWDEGAASLTLWTSTQTPHGVKQQLAIALGIPETRVRVVAPEVGGGFGCKIPTYPEELLLGWVSRRLQQPVKWSETRTENLMNTTHGRGHVETVEAAFRSDGVVTALRGKTLAELGAFPSMLGAVVPTFTLQMICGCYRIPHVAWRVQGIYTHTMSTEAYRGAGRPEAAYVIERVMDAVARRLDLDPAEVRRRNFIAPDAFPYATPTGPIYDTGRYEDTQRRALERFDYEGARAQQASARRSGRLVGIGVCSFTEICGLGPSTDASPEQRHGLWECAEVRVEPTGAVTVLTGISPHGQGEETAFAQLVADAFGIGIDDVVVRHGDTDVVPHGVGTFGSRGIAVGGAALQLALDRIVEKARRIAAHLLDTTEDRVELEGGEFRIRGAERSLSFRDVAMAAHLWNVPVPGLEPGLEAVARFEPGGTTFPFSTHLCQVEVDPETGEIEIQRYLAVDDVGRVINPLIADGQRLGGIVQGLSQALWEEARYDPSGQLLTATLMDYALPKASFLPLIELDRTCTPTPVNPLGAKGIGELGTIGSTPTLVCAVLDALAPRGIEHLDMPLHPEKIWRALRGVSGTS